MKKETIQTQEKSSVEFTPMILLCYFENHNPSSNDQKNKIIASKKILRNAKLNRLLQLDMSNKKIQQISC